MRFCWCSLKYEGNRFCRESGALSEVCSTSGRFVTNDRSQLWVTLAEKGLGPGWLREVTGGWLARLRSQGECVSGHAAGSLVYDGCHH